MPLPKNAQAIYGFLIGQGFNANAAAGISGNIYQESGGDPQAGHNPPGAGLIQILGDPGGTLDQELKRTMDYIRANGSVSDINAHSSSPEAAALWFSQKYERPGIPNNPARVQAAKDVAAAAASGKWQGYTIGSVQSSPSSGGGIGDVVSWLTGIPNTFADFFTIFHNLISPTFWLRIGAFFAGVALLAVGIYVLIKADSDKPLSPHMPSIVPIPV